MSVKDNFILALACFAAISMYRGCDLNKQLIGSEKEVLGLIGNQSGMSVKINEQGKEIAEQKALYLDERAKNETLFERIKKLESTVSNYTVNTKTVIERVKVPILKTDTVRENGEAFERHSFDYAEPYFSVSGYADKHSLFIDTLFVPSKLTLSHKWTKKNILAKKEYVVQASVDNPYVSVSGMNNYTFVEEKKWHEKRGVMLITGFMIGALVNSR